jgi:5-methylcytosine-specific restriction enzyme subunit McrC
MRIPIENIYYLLCYAWNKLDEKERINVSAQDYTELADLFAKVLTSATKVLLKRGIGRSYIEVTNELAGVKGKIAISDTIKSNLLFKQRTICSYDEFSSNILINQILVTTLHTLLRIKQLDKNLKNEVRSLILMFPEIDKIEFKYATFRRVRLTRNTHFYGFILNVCEIIYECSLPTEDPGTLTFMDFTRDENKMNQLFEAFIRNFYRLEQKRFTTVKTEVINWQFSAASNSDFQYLPEMHTDITLENENEKIIIDAKYYSNTMAINFEKERVHSGNLYQLFSYLINQENGKDRNKKAVGILLYPTIEAEYNLEYQYRFHKIQIKTVNLNSDWRTISSRLKEIISIEV